MLFYRLKNFFKNLWWYRRELWDDNEGDFEYTLSLLKRKLMKSKKVGFPYGGDGERHVKEISICINLIDRILKDDYSISEIINDNWIWGDYANRPPLKTKFPKVVLYEHMTYMKEQDLDLLFKMMRKYIQCWWD